MPTTNNVNSFNSSSTKPLYRGTQIVWYIVGLLEAILAFRFILKFLEREPLCRIHQFYLLHKLSVCHPIFKRV